MNYRSSIAESPRACRRPNGVSGGTESYERIPSKMWERLWAQFARCSNLSRKSNAIILLLGDPYGFETAVRHLCKLTKGTRPVSQGSRQEPQRQRRNGE